MKPFNLLIDSNFLFYKTMFVSKGYGKITHPYLSEDKEQGQLMRKVAMDFVHDINLFKGYDKIVMVRDLKSWRKKFYSEYKANREYKADVDWDKMFSLMDEFLDIMKENFNVIVSKIEGAEGDDLLYYWSEYFNDNNESSIILTGDKDLTQLVNHNIKNETFTIVYNNNSTTKKIVAKKGFTKWINGLSLDIVENDIFNMDEDLISGENSFSVSKNIIKTFEIEEIDPQSVILSKVLCGDSGDNIPSIWEWINKNGNRTRITNRHYIKLYEDFQDQYNEVDVMDINSNKNLKMQVKEKLQEYAKIKINDRDFFNNFNLNIRLVCLNSEFIPEEITDEFFQQVKNIELPKTCGIQSKEDIFKTLGKYNTKEYITYEPDGSFLSNLFKD